MRIGTWNMEGRRGSAQTAFLEAQDCDVWLLTEVNNRWSLPGYHMSAGSAAMGTDKRWAVIASRLTMDELPSPHEASSAARVAGVTFVASILPWRSCGSSDPWRGEDHATRMANTLYELTPFLRAQSNLVWGGDWNHALAGREYAGSAAGRRDLMTLIGELGLRVPTADLPHRLPSLLSIDHVALRGPWSQAHRVIATDNGVRLSDHDLYVVDTTDRDDGVR